MPALPFEAAFDADQPAAAERLASETGRPRVLVETSGTRLVVVGADSLAASFGIRAGQTLAAAQALRPDLATRLRQPAAEAARLDLLANWAYGYSSQVVLEPPTGLLIEVGSSLRLFGGWPALERILRTGLSQLGHAHRLVVAPVAAAARVLAHQHDGMALFDQSPLSHALGHLPVDACGFDAATALKLERMGLRQLREVLRLPRPELTRRIGTAAALHLARLCGNEAEPLLPYRPPDRFERRVEFDGLLESVEQLSFSIKRICNELQVFLYARDGGVQRFAIRLEHEHKPATELAIGLLTPQRDGARLFEAARGHLERVTIAAPVVALSIIAAELPAFRPELQDLFAPRAGAGLSRADLLDRLRAKLGDQAVRTIEVKADHRPEVASSHRPAAAGFGEASATPALATHWQAAGQRPLWLLPEPVPLAASAWAVLAGPERIESGWWDDGDIRRDYYVLGLPSGQQAWAFRAPGISQWMLHGWFA